MALEHMPADDSLQILKIPSNPGMRALRNFQDGDTLASPVSRLSPIPGTCPQCYRRINPGVTTEALAAMES